MIGLSQRAYSRHRGVTHRAVQKAIATGRIPTLADGSIDVAAADAAWIRNTDETKSSNSVSGDPSHRRPAGGPPMPAGTRTKAATRAAASTTGADGIPSNASAGYSAARALRETYAARRERLRFEEETKLLVPASEVKADAFNTARRVRDLLMAVPDRIAPILASLTSAADCHRTLTAEIRRALAELHA